MKPASIFISYSHKDEPFRDEFLSHLAPLKRAGLIEPWHDRCLRPGVDWAAKIDYNIDKADIIILLISSDFLASNYCYEKEFARGLVRHEAKKTIIIPVIIRSVLWEQTTLSRLQALPRDAKPVEEWQYRDRAWTDVVRGILNTINGISQIESGYSFEQRVSPNSDQIPVKIPEADAMYEDVGLSDDLINRWQDLKQLHVVFPSFALALAQYRRDVTAFKSIGSENYELIMSLMNSQLPPDMIVFYTTLILIRNTEERIKVEVKLLEVLSLLEETDELQSTRINHSLIHLENLGLEGKSIDGCKNHLAELMNEYKDLFNAALVSSEGFKDALDKIRSC
jgi:hypothetical protein